MCGDCGDHGDTVFEFTAWPSAQLGQGKKSMTLVLRKLKSLELGSLKKSVTKRCPPSGTSDETGHWGSFDS